MRFLTLGTVVFSLWSCSLFGQDSWTTIRLDENLSFTFPSEHKRSDTLGQVNFHAKTNFAYIQVVKIPQPQAQITSKNDLKDYYRSFQKLTIDQSYGELLSDSVFELNELYAKAFKFENYWNDSLEVQENTIFLVDNSMYLFTYAYFEEEQQRAKKDREKFFSRIAFDDKNLDDQLTVRPDKYEEAGEFVGYTLRYILAAIVLLAIILFYLKKYQIVKSIVNVLSLAFLIWGAFCVILLAANLLFGSNFMDYKFGYILNTGIIFLIIGFVLRKIKLLIKK